MKNLAIIPARSGSKGLKDKNIKLLCGKPLLAYTIEAAKKTDLFEEIVVSTDSKDYASIAIEWGANVPFLRSKQLSSDTASSWDVVKDIIAKYKDMGREFDTVALLQPTSPLRRAEDIVNGYIKMKKENANTVVAVCETDHSPLWSNTLPKDGSFEKFLDKDIIKTPRQYLPIYYRINGALYIIKTEHLMSTEDIYLDKSYAIIMDREHSIDIDNIIDFKVVEAILCN